MTFCIDVITADTSSLRDRGLAYAFTSSPYIITAFAGPSAAQRFNEVNWRWGYGCFAIVLPVVALPYFVLLRYNRSLAKKRGLLVNKEHSGRNWAQSIWYYVVQFDSEWFLGMIDFQSLTGCSHWNIPPGRGSCPFPTAFQHRRVR